ncbi:hypothetical protein [Sutcliffiella cohnii]|uniref:hypothetical protein n=1 Tax=Sutcliffiella cohnii TaxID=33932 RepID=UPI000A718357|nr:hypothetical protein [Sutcliffiella cohnii]
MLRLLVIVLVAVGMLVGCNNSQSTSPANEEKEKVIEENKEQEATRSDEDEINEIIKQNLIAAENKDLKAYMSTLHTEAPAYASTSDMMEEFFSTYDVKYTWDEIEVVEIKGTEAEVRVVQTTLNIGDVPFDDNRLEAVHTMKVEDGEWKIYATEVIDVVYLNETTETNSEVDTEINAANFFSLYIPLLDEENGNSPGQDIPNDTYEFLLENEELFPVSSSNLSKAIDMVNEDIEYRNLSKTLNRYTTTMYYDSGYVIDIYEEFIPELDSYFTHLYISNDYDEVYEVLYLGSLDDIFYEDYVEFIGVPTIHSGFDNVSGGYTNVIVVIGSHVEKLN